MPDPLSDLITYPAELEVLSIAHPSNFPMQLWHMRVRSNLSNELFIDLMTQALQTSGFIRIDKPGTPVFEGNGLNVALTVLGGLDSDRFRIIVVDGIYQE